MVPFGNTAQTREILAFDGRDLRIGKSSVDFVEVSLAHRPLEAAIERACRPFGVVLAELRERALQTELRLLTPGGDQRVRSKPRFGVLPFGQETGGALLLLREPGLEPGAESRRVFCQNARRTFVVCTFEDRDDAGIPNRTGVGPFEQRAQSGGVCAELCREVRGANHHPAARRFLEERDVVTGELDLPGAGAGGR